MRHNCYLRCSSCLQPDQLNSATVRLVVLKQVLEHRQRLNSATIALRIGSESKRLRLLPRLRKELFGLLTSMQRVCGSLELVISVLCTAFYDCLINSNWLSRFLSHSDLRDIESCPRSWL